MNSGAATRGDSSASPTTDRTVTIQHPSPGCADGPASLGRVCGALPPEHERDFVPTVDRGTSGHDGGCGFPGPVWESACLEEVCGACTMLINGKSRQACSALVDKLGKPDEPVTLEPLE